MLILSKCQSNEFEVQVYLLNELKALGYIAEGEVRGMVSHVKTGEASGNKVRLDILLFKGTEPCCAIEVKRARSDVWKADYQRSKQFKIYSLLGLPVLIVCGMNEAMELLRKHETLLRLTPGIHWVVR
jgi:hypothetical protein